jgi:hypothetical protein
VPPRRRGVEGADLEALDCAGTARRREADLLLGIIGGPIRDAPAWWLPARLASLRVPV